MDLFHSHQIEKMAAEHDMEGLYKLLEHNDKVVRLEAAQALADLGDGTGWRFLMETAREASDPDSQAVAVSMLGELGHPRALPILEEALRKARGEMADTIKEAIEAIGGREADDALRRAGYEPVLPHMQGDQQITDFEATYVRAVLPDTANIEFLTAEQHLNNAVQLREAELPERGLVEDSLAIWLNAEWAYAWYLRGVLFEDLDRSFEAALAYRWSLELDPHLDEAREALDDLEKEHTFQPLDPDMLLTGLAANDWTERRDAAAGFGDLGQATDAAIDRMIELLNDDEREVRHAVIEALGNIEDARAVVPLLQRQEKESSWMLRFAIIEALAQMGSVDGLETALHNEMNRIQERNPVFSSHKDPLLEIEYDRLMEIGVLAFEETGNVDALIDLAEGNAWEAVDVGEEDEDNAADFESAVYNEDEASGLLVQGVEDAEAEDLEADEDLTSYVDEVAMMACVALERLTLTNLAALNDETLDRLAEIPDLTLLDITAEAGEEESEETAPEEQAQPEPTMVHDFKALREAAQQEQARRR